MSANIKLNVPAFKPGDRIIVHTCPRDNRELGWTGTVEQYLSQWYVHSSYVHDAVRVLVDGKHDFGGKGYVYDVNNVRLLTPLDLVLK